jgi:hypothetical protein
MSRFYHARAKSALCTITAIAAAALGFRQTRHSVAKKQSLLVAAASRQCYADPPLSSGKLTFAVHSCSVHAVVYVFSHPFPSGQRQG